MALSATIYVLEIELADSDRGVYEQLTLRVARHPSETAEYLLTRVLAYCLEYREGIAFSKGLSEPDEPAVVVRDLSGVLQCWIEIGAPDAPRLHRAAKAAPRVAVYVHRDAPQLLARLRGERIHRAEQVAFYALDAGWLAGWVAKLERRMKLSLTVAAQHLYLSIGSDTSSAPLERLQLEA